MVATSDSMEAETVPGLLAQNGFLLKRWAASFRARRA